MSDKQTYFQWMYRGEDGALNRPTVVEGHCLEVFRIELNDLYESEEQAVNELAEKVFDDKYDLVLCKVEIEPVKEFPLCFTKDNDEIQDDSNMSIGYIDFMQKTIWVKGDPLPDEKITQYAKEIGEDITLVGKWEEYTLHGEAGHIRKINRH